MGPINGFFLIEPEDLDWKLSNIMKLPNADLLERTESEVLGARLWRLPPQSANTLHRHLKMEEFYFVLEGVGRMRIADHTVTVPKYGGVMVGPSQLRQVFNDTEADALWLIIGSPEREREPGEVLDPRLVYPVDPKQLPPELAEVNWPPKV